LFLIKVTLPPFDKYIIFHPAKRLYLLNNIIPNRFALNEAAIGKPKYFIGKEKTLQPKMLAKPPTLLTLPMGGTNSDLAKLILKPETASKHKNKQHKL
jgi:hypothetical protein